MVFNIYDSSLERQGEINTFISSTWNEKLCDRGVCQLVVADSPAASALLTVGRFVGKSGSDTLWQIKTKEKRGGNLWVNGYTSNYTLLFDRVYAGTHTYLPEKGGASNVLFGQNGLDLCSAKTTAALS